jgi:hypothetical protein
MVIQGTGVTGEARPERGPVIDPDGHADAG